MYSNVIKSIFHCKLGSRWVSNANKMSPNNMKCTWPTRKFCVGDPTQPIFHCLALGFCVGGNAYFMFCVGGNANFSAFGYQHVGIPMQRKISRLGSKLMQGPNASVFASQWNRLYKNSMHIVFQSIINVLLPVRSQTIMLKSQMCLGNDLSKCLGLC